MPGGKRKQPVAAAAAGDTQDATPGGRKRQTQLDVFAIKKAPASKNIAEDLEDHENLAEEEDAHADEETQEKEESEPHQEVAGEEQPDKKLRKKNTDVSVSDAKKGAKAP